MTSPWLKIRHDLDQDPAVIAMALCLGMAESQAVGLLVKFWGWADRNLTAENASAKVSPDWVDRFVGWPGFAKALADAGWLLIGDGSISVPNFDRHMGQSAKTRSHEAERKRVYRQQQPPKPKPPTPNPEQSQESVVSIRGTVPKMSQNVRDKSGTVSQKCPGKNGTREDKRREEENRETTTVVSFCPETVPRSSRQEPIFIEPSILDFPTDGTVKSWSLTQSQIDEWASLFPSIDILAECRKAFAWIKAKPSRRKTARGMPACLVSWLSNANDKPSRSGPGQYQAKPNPFKEAGDRVRAGETADPAIAELFSSKRQESEPQGQAIAFGGDYQ